MHLGETLGGALLTSVLGALAVRWGFHPTGVSIALGGLGGLAAWRSEGALAQYAGLGAASAAGSQLMLLQMNPLAKPAQAALPATPVTAHLPPPAAHPAIPSRPRAADLGGLEPGMLDAALERARAELAVAGDGYPPSYQPAHHHHHQSIPFVP